VEQATASGGTQEFYRYDARVRNTASELGEGLDTRNDGGYVVAPPSTIELEPIGSRRHRGYKFRGNLSLEKLVAGEATNNTSDYGGPNGSADKTVGEPHPPSSHVQ
jgi:hypothetical protein